MDYTTTARLKLEKDIKENGNDALISLLVTTASRDADRYCTGQPGPISDNYFQQAALTETLRGWLNADGDLVFYSHKPIIQSVASLQYKMTFDGSYNAVNSTLIEIDSSPYIIAHTGLPVRPVKVWAQIAYTGGLAATVDALPNDFVEAVTADAIRIFQENKAGIADALGTVETGVLIYSKSMPVRVQRMFEPYRRTGYWNTP